MTLTFHSLDAADMIFYRYIGKIVDVQQRQLNTDAFKVKFYYLRQGGYVFASV